MVLGIRPCQSAALVTESYDLNIRFCDFPYSDMNSEYFLFSGMNRSCHWTERRSAAATSPTRLCSGQSVHVFAGDYRKQWISCHSTLRFCIRSKIQLQSNAFNCLGSPFTFAFVSIVLKSWYIKFIFDKIVELSEGQKFTNVFWEWSSTCMRYCISFINWTHNQASCLSAWIISEITNVFCEFSYWSSRLKMFWSSMIVNIIGPVYLMLCKKGLSQ